MCDQEDTAVTQGDESAKDRSLPGCVDQPIAKEGNAAGHGNTGDAAAF